MDSRISLINILASRLLQQGQTITTVESCTGGGIAKALTDLPGSSQWFETGFVTYSNLSKSNLVGVDKALIAAKGAVSIEVAEAMARGGSENANADYAVAVTGIAGPGGGSDKKPVGLVCFGWALPDGKILSDSKVFSGDRISIREQTIDFALKVSVQYLAQ